MAHLLQQAPPPVSCGQSAHIGAFGKDFFRQQGLVLSEVSSFSQAPPLVPCGRRAFIGALGKIVFHRYLFRRMICFPLWRSLYCPVPPKPSFLPLSLYTSGSSFQAPPPVPCGREIFIGAFGKHGFRRWPPGPHRPGAHWSSAPAQQNIPNRSPAQRVRFGKEEQGSAARNPRQGVMSAADFATTRGSGAGRSTVPT